MNLGMKTIGILGANGFLGSNLVNYFSEHFTVTGITKENYREFMGKEFDLLINANGNSKRFWANQNPAEDYIASVESVEKSIDSFRFSRYVFISSSDVYPYHGDPAQTSENQIIDESKLEPYGLHKYQAEKLVQTLPSYIILRCSAMIGPGLKKGIIKDILEGAEIFITPESHIQFILCSEIARTIEQLVSGGIENTIFNCGGKGSVEVTEMFELLNKKSPIRSDAQLQQYEMDVGKLDKLVGLETSKQYLQKFLTL